MDRYGGREGVVIHSLSGCNWCHWSSVQLYHENEKLRQEIKRLRKESSEIDQDRGFYDSEYYGEGGREGMRMSYVHKPCP